MHTRQYIQLQTWSTFKQFTIHYGNSLANKVLSVTSLECINHSVSSLCSQKSCALPVSNILSMHSRIFQFLCPFSCLVVKGNLQISCHLSRNLYWPPYFVGRCCNIVGSSMDNDKWWQFIIPISSARKGHLLFNHGRGIHKSRTFTRLWTEKQASFIRADKFFNFLQQSFITVNYCSWITSECSGIVSTPKWPAICKAFSLIFPRKLHSHMRA